MSGEALAAGSMSHVFQMFLFLALKAARFVAQRFHDVSGKGVANRLNNGNPALASSHSVSAAHHYQTFVETDVDTFAATL